jgi:hypothetical protein
MVNTKLLSGILTGSLCGGCNLFEVNSPDYFRHTEFSSNVVLPHWDDDNARNEVYCDVNRDGRTDKMVIDKYGIILLNGTGPRNSQEFRNARLIINLPHEEIYGIEVCDLNLDGYPDLQVFTVRGRWDYRNTAKSVKILP